MYVILLVTALLFLRSFWGMLITLFIIVLSSSTAMGLAGWLGRPVRTYSRGQLQRVALARALMHGPRLVLLDEPSSGLDAASSERLHAALREERERGAIVVVVTHDSALSDAVADRRVRLSRGPGRPPRGPRAPRARRALQRQRRVAGSLRGRRGRETCAPAGR